MATTPQPRSFNQILGQMSDAFLSRYGLPGLKRGGPVLSLLEVVAQNAVRTSQDVFTLLNLDSLKNCRGVALDRKGKDEKLPRTPQSPATGKVDVLDIAFTKIASVVSQAQAAPIVGTTSLNVADATSFPASGSLYIGRGTGQYEGPLAYSSKTNNGTHWTITLSSATLRFHNQGEPVVIAQGGNRVIGAGTTVQTPQGNVRDAVKFTTLYSATIPDGEVLVTNVPVVAQQSGVIGNVASKAISQFVGSGPFAGSTVTNPLPFTNGTEIEKDDAYRERIEAARQSRTRGTGLALITYAVGTQALDENRKVISASYVAGIGDLPGTLYIDDGTGYEERSDGVAIESLTDQALGGETRFELVNRPVAKAFLTSTLTAPFTLVSGAKLAFTVGGITTEHTLDVARFSNIGNATGYELVASINSDTGLLWSARTVESGTKVAVFAKTDVNEDVELATPSGTDANTYLGFPTGRADTLRLYKNDRLLSKDGRTALLRSKSFSFWQALSGTQTLILAVDSTPAVTYSFTAQDFIDASTGYTTMGVNSLAAWVLVLNRRLPGITASISLGALQLVSNRGASSTARIVITGGTLVTNLVFEASDVSGTNRDYVLDRNVSQIELTAALSSTDRLAAGTTQTRAFLESTAISAVNLAAQGNLWFSLDGAASIISTGVTSSTPVIITVPTDGVKHWGYRLRLTVAAGAFTNVLKGDVLVCWDSAFNADLKGNWTIAKVATDGSYIELEKAAMWSYRADHTQVTLADGRVLVCGGYSGHTRTAATKTCEVFDPATNKWTQTGEMSVSRVGHAMVLLASGKVFVFGGTKDGTDAQVVAAGETWDPATDTWTPASTTGQPPARTRHAMALGHTGLVYVNGGIDASSTYLATTFVYDATGDTWTAKASMADIRASHTLSLLSDNTLIAVAGEYAAACWDKTEIYDPGANTWANGGPIQSARQAHRAVVLDNTNLLITGGSTTRHVTAATPSVHTDQYTVGGAWANGTVLNKARAYHGMCKLANGKVVVGFGDQAAGTPYAEISTTAACTAWTNTADPNGALIRRRVGCTALASNRALFTGGMGTTTLEQARASVEVYDAAVGPAWRAYDPNVATVSLATSGLTVARMGGRPIKASVALGNNYTASSFNDALALAGGMDSTYKGATPAVFRTTQLRASTNTFARRLASGLSPTRQPGDIMLIAADADGQKLAFTAGTRVDNLDGHLGSIESGSPETGTPEFRVAFVKGSTSITKPQISWAGIAATTLPSSGHFVVGLGSNLDAYLQDRRAQNAGYWGQIGTQSYDGFASGLDYLTVRKTPDKQWTPEERVYLAHPFAFSPYDQLTVLADGDTTSKRFTNNLYRKLKPVGSTYGTTNEYQDADPTTPTSLGRAFGLSYDFSDFAAYMRSRVLTHSADASKRVLWRWFRHGPEGNAATASYVLPSAPDAAVGVTVQDDLAASPGSVLCSIALASGSLKTGYTLRPGTRIGVACTALTTGMATVVYAMGLAIASAARTTNVTTLTLTMPTGVVDSGLAVSNVVWVKSTDPNFTSGLYSITVRTATTISYAETAADQGATANIGNVSYDSTEATLAAANPSLAVGDFLRVESTAGISAFYEGQTIRVTAFADQYLIGKYENFGSTTSTTLTWGQLTDANAFKLFANPAQTATVIAAAVSALYTAGSCPIQPTVTGTGAGTIGQSSSEEAAVASTTFALADGRNWISSQSNPATINDNYTFTFKDSITTALASNTDWANEDVRIVPVSARAVAAWFMQPAVSGMFTAVKAQVSSRARHLQLHSLLAGSAGSIQVQGGGANAWTASIKGSGKAVSTTHVRVSIPRGSLDSIVGQAWFALDNTSAMPKSVFVSTSKLLTVDTAGKFTFDAGGAPVWADAGPGAIANASMRIERHGAFVCYTATGLTALDLTGVLEGDWAVIKAAASPTGGVPQIVDANVGTFRIVRVATNTLDGAHSFWIENAGAVENTGCELDVKFIDRDSLMPGDVLTISTSLWHASNKGVWTVSSVGDAGAGEFLNNYTFKVSVSARATVAAAPNVDLGAEAALVIAKDALPARYVKRLIATSIDQDSPSTLAHLKFEGTRGWEVFSEAAGTIITALDKLAFSTLVAAGQDGYRKSTGLLAVVNKVVYGDPDDTATYPGVAAAGARINIQGPLVRRLTFAMLVRLRSGYPAADVAAAVRSAIASVINQSKLGKSIAISSIITAAEQVIGVESVVPVTNYGIGADLIQIQPSEKPLVTDIDQDVLVSFVGV